MNVFEGRTAVVTGGGSGIGKAVCEALGERGARIVVTDLDGASADRVAKGIAARGGRAEGRPLDVRDRAAVEALVDEVATAHGRLDYMFNNAGIVVSGEERDVSADDWKQVLDVDLHGVVHGSRAAYARMVRQGSGHIVNTASLAGLTPASMMISYSTAKYGVVGLSHALRAEGRKLGVKVSVVCPGFIDTPIITDSPLRMGIARERLLAMAPKPMPPDRCARVILDGVAKNRATIIPTAHAKLFYLLQRLSPDAAIALSAAVVERTRKMRDDG
jgi:NAD(P)-dependent dehydrogenase (short-subunit alcohol dehydrogenase family)